MLGTKALLGFVVAVMFYLLVWPTLYRYDHLGTYPVRINRITGAAEMLRPEGWTLLTPPRLPDTVPTAKANVPIGLNPVTDPELLRQLNAER